MAIEILDPNTPTFTQSPPNNVIKKTNKFRTLKILLAVSSYLLCAILIVLLFMGTSQILETKRIGQPVYTWSQDKNTEPVLNQDGVVSLALDSRSPLINQLAVVYQFSGTILDIKDTSEGKEIFTDIKGINIPRFIYDPYKTTVYIGSDHYNYSDVVTFDNLKVGQKIRLNSYYELRKKVWVMRGVYIL